MKIFQQKFFLTLFCCVLWGSSALLAQRQITGQVTDAENGDALIGASIIVEGSTVGTSTDFDGKDSLNIPATAKTLRITYTGYATQTVDIGASNVLDFRMSTAAVLEEVVVVGYGTVKRVDLTGSVQAVGTKDFKNVHFSLKAYPTIASESIAIEILSEENQVGQLELTNLLGQSFAVKKCVLTQGSQTETMNITNVPNGLYFLTLTIGDERAVVKIIKE